MYFFIRVQRNHYFVYCSNSSKKAWILTDINLGLHTIIIIKNTEHTILKDKKYELFKNENQSILNTFDAVCVCVCDLKIRLNCCRNMTTNDMKLCYIIVSVSVKNLSDRKMMQMERKNILNKSCLFQWVYQQWIDKLILS